VKPIAIKGISGIGECWTFDTDIAALVVFLRTEIAPRVVGMGARLIEAVAATGRVPPVTPPCSRLALKNGPAPVPRSTLSCVPCMDGARGARGI
jgi:hypothetical protein